MNRKAREAELQKYEPTLDTRLLSDTELDGLISMAARKQMDVEERGERPPRRIRRR